MFTYCTDTVFDGNHESKQRAKSMQAYVLHFLAANRMSAEIAMVTAPISAGDGMFTGNVSSITFVGSTRQSAVDFWQGVLGMPFLFEQPNLGNPDENHLYFDPGDGRLLTVFTDETRQDAGRHAPREIGCVEHLAFNVSRATFALAPASIT